MSHRNCSSPPSPWWKWRVSWLGRDRRSAGGLPRASPGSSQRSGPVVVSMPYDTFRAITLSASSPLDTGAGEKKPILSHPSAFLCCGGFFYSCCKDLWSFPLLFSEQGSRTSLLHESCRISPELSISPLHYPSLLFFLFLCPLSS